MSADLQRPTPILLPCVLLVWTQRRGIWMYGKGKMQLQQQAYTTSEHGKPTAICDGSFNIFPLAMKSQCVRFSRYSSCDLKCWKHRQKAPHWSHSSLKKLQETNEANKFADSLVPLPLSPASPCSHQGRCREGAPSSWEQVPVACALHSHSVIHGKGRSSHRSFLHLAGECSPSACTRQCKSTTRVSCNVLRLWLAHAWMEQSHHPSLQRQSARVCAFGWTRAWSATSPWSSAPPGWGAGPPPRYQQQTHLSLATA